MLVFALVGVWSLGPDSAWGGRPGPRHRADPNGILAYLARVLPPIGIIVGTYIFWVGADHPGGKFQGATIVAAMWLLVIMAGLADAPPISRTWVRVGLVAGPLVFIAIGLAGAATAGAFLAYPDGYAKPLIIVIELALMPTLALILALLLTGAPQRPVRDERRHALRPLRRAARRHRHVRPRRERASAAQDPRVQRGGQRRVPAAGRHRAARRGSGPGRRPGAAGAADHRHRRRVLGHRARGRRAAAPVRRHRHGHARGRCACRAEADTSRPGSPVRPAPECRMRCPHPT